MLTAEELHRRGLAHSHAGRYASARQLFRRALERSAEPDVEAQVKLSLAYVEAELGSTSHGMSLCQDALAVGGLSRQVRGLVESQIALLHVRAGAGSAALAAFASAIALLDESPEPRARALLNRSLVYLQRGDPERAEDDARQAADLYRLAGDEVKAAKADHNRGCARLLAGDLVAALRLMESAAPLLERLSPTSRAVVAQDRAEVLVAAGMPADATAALESAARAYGVRRLRQRQAEVELILARTLSAEEPLRAAAVARRAAQRFRSRGSDVWAVRAEAVKVAAEVAAGRSAAPLAARAGQLAERLQTYRLTYEALEMTLCAARANLRAGDRAAAVRDLAAARPGPGAPLRARLLAHEVRAEAAVAAGRRSTALRQLRAGLAELHEWQSGFGSLDLQTSLVGNGRGLALEGMRLALADGRADVVFEWSERARALASRVPAVRPPADAAAAQALAELRSATDGATAAVLRTRIRQQSWYGEGAREVRDPASLDEVAAALDAEGAVLASYLAVGGRLHCLVVRGSSRSVVRLGSVEEMRRLLAGMQADLDMAATTLPAALRTSVIASLRQRLTRLAERIVAPVPGLSDGERVLVVPTGALAGTPWSMLPGLTGRMLTIPRSASLWLADRATATAAAAPRTVGLVAGPAVARADEEVGRAAAAWANASVLAGAGARVHAVSRLAQRVDVLHVAAHGRHSADNPLFSGLELADGPWFGYDIDQLAAIPSTVILSACELGRSAVRWGEETIGMTVAWLHAGARCVIAAPASVADDVACGVLGATHAGLAAGSAPAEALADAVRSADAGNVSSFLCFGSGF